MSTYYGYRCRTCNLDSERPFNHGEDCLREAYDVRKEIAAIRQCWSLEIAFMGYGGNCLEFLITHSEHDLCIYNEYGETEDMQSDPA